MMNSDILRKEFPILGSGTAGEKELVYLDSAASSLTPEPVLEAMNAYYRGFRSNVHRGLYPESEQATEAYEGVRTQVAKFIGASTPAEIIFTRGTTESLNHASRLIAQHLEAGDEILVTAYDHHSNIVPWQILAREKQLVIRMVRPHIDTHDITADDIRDCITPRTKVLALPHVSNVTGLTLNVAELAAAAKESDLMVVVDGAQAAPHIPVNVHELGCDVYAFSGHKLFGPTGVGVLWARMSLLESVEPVFGGGGIVDTVDVESSTWDEIPHRFEPGTPPIAEVIGLGAALAWLQHTAGSMQVVSAYNTELYTYLLNALQTIPQVRVLGVHADASRHHGSVAIHIHGAHPHDIAAYLAEQRIAVRAGHHCAQPLMRHFGIAAATRFSVHMTNTTDDIDAAVAALKKAITLFTT